jgi:hypothetical protein
VAALVLLARGALFVHWSHAEIRGAIGDGGTFRPPLPPPKPATMEDVRAELVKLMANFVVAGVLYMSLLGDMEACAPVHPSIVGLPPEEKARELRSHSRSLFCDDAHVLPRRMQYDSAIMSPVLARELVHSRYHFVARALVEQLDMIERGVHGQTTAARAPAALLKDRLKQAVARGEPTGGDRREQSERKLGMSRLSAKVRPMVENAAAVRLPPARGF